MEKKFFLCVLLFWAVPDVQPASDVWAIDVPSTIPAVQGECVLIPCWYTYPTTKIVLNRWMGFWKRGNTIVSTNLKKWKLAKEFNKRTEFVGALQVGNCSMLLHSVRTTDIGPFYLQVRIPQFKSFTFTENKVSIDVIRQPEPPAMSFQILDTVRAYCSVLHSCPSAPPRFSWSQAGVTATWSKQINLWMWKTESVLEFVPDSLDFNPVLNCSVVYRGGKTAKSSVVLIK
ncbi:myeloid cell surface antigen CD33 isoform X1 [Nothobranchius furzeri]|uniref:myeloid cell surface antigen CD33 isoform X1 n=1 Tax=Nothobranchius furzeri TaxID=105023 RepID=UPI003904892C